MEFKKNEPIPFDEAVKDLSKVIDLVDNQQLAIVSISQERQYAVIDFRTYEGLKKAYLDLMDRIGDEVINENLEALKELAK